MFKFDDDMGEAAAAAAAIADVIVVLQDSAEEGAARDLVVVEHDLDLVGDRLLRGERHKALAPSQNLPREYECAYWSPERDISDPAIAESFPTWTALGTSPSLMDISSWPSPALLASTGQRGEVRILVFRMLQHDRTYNYTYLLGSMIGLIHTC